MIQRLDSKIDTTALNTDVLVSNVGSLSDLVTTSKLDFHKVRDTMINGLFDLQKHQIEFKELTKSSTSNVETILSDFSTKFLDDFSNKLQSVIKKDMKLTTRFDEIKKSIT
jgi:lipoate-protein ligase A